MTCHELVKQFRCPVLNVSCESKISAQLEYELYRLARLEASTSLVWYGAPYCLVVPRGQKLERVQEKRVAYSVLAFIEYGFWRRAEY